MNCGKCANAKSICCSVQYQSCLRKRIWKQKFCTMIGRSSCQEAITDGRVVARSSSRNCLRSHGCCRVTSFFLAEAFQSQGFAVPKFGMTSYSVYQRIWAEQTRQQDPGLRAGRAAEGDRRGAISRRSRHRRGVPLFQSRTRRDARRLRRAVHERALPGILAMAVRNEYYDTLEAYLAALDAAAYIPHGRAAPRIHGQRSKPA